MLFRCFGKVHGLLSVIFDTKMLSQKRFDVTLFKLTTATAPILAIAGVLGMSLPSNAVSTSFRRNDYRVCAARLLSVGIPVEAASAACAAALRPRELSSCVGKIQRKTQIPATDSLSFCGRARRANDFAICVVGIGTRSQETANRAIMSYCNRSLLPVEFAKCVVGLRSEIDFSSTQAMKSCIDANDIITKIVPSSIPGNRSSEGFSPTFETTPIR